MTTAKEIVARIEGDGVDFVDFRFTDLRGKWQHLSQHRDTITEAFLTEGVPFDGSSIAGWKDINESDMLLVPQLETCVKDPFSENLLVIVCDVHEPASRARYNRDPRGVARRAEEYLASTGIGDTAYFGPEPEFFVFDSVRFSVTPNASFYYLDSTEDPYNSGKEYSGGNRGHRPGPKGGYFPVPPVDHSQDMRSDMVLRMLSMGVSVEKHHHEVAPSQHELGIKFDTLVRSADNVQKYKYVVHNVAEARGKTATFMPKPIMADNGSGMHCHQSIWKKGKPVFAGEGYQGLSQEALWYIGGIIKHGRAINVFTNPTTNSFKRLVPGYEAPVFLAYAARNRSASCRIPHADNPGGKRVEVRFPDAAANPYLAFAAMMMAGIDGIQNRIDPGKALERNLYEMPEDEIVGLPTVCRSLREAVRETSMHHDFLLKGNVFSEDMIEAYLHLKRQELHLAETTTSALEFQMYYSV
jgi:glutamine synthetase